MRTIFITGAAQGIGLATARHFAKQGCFIGLYDINTDALESLLASGEFPNACGHYCDVTDRQSIVAAFEHFASHTGNQMDVLVNNAGVLSSGNFEDLDFSAHELMIDVNVKGLTNVAQLAFPLLQQTPNAVMVNLCSVSSVHGIPLLAVYSASKYYVNGLTEALSIEWARHGIRVTSVKPPLVNTNMGHAVRPELMTKFSVDMQPEDVALAIDKACAGSRISYLLGGTSKLWGWMDKYLPEGGRRNLTRYLTGQ